jgi:diphosphomevalonate decarboxylase
MMMSSDPYFILMKPNTLEIINLLWTYRKRTKIPVCFTLDAGANVHVLYPKKHAIEVELFVKNKLSAYCQNNQYILDNVGEGAERIKI